MLCCAVAAFIICNIAMAFARVRAFFFGAPEPAEHSNPAVAWQFGMPAAPLATARRAQPVRRIVLAVAAVALIVTMGAALMDPQPAASSSEDISVRPTPSICGAFT